MLYFSETSEELTKTDAIGLEIELEWKNLGLIPAIRRWVEEYPPLDVPKDVKIFQLALLTKTPPPLGIWLGVAGKLDAHDQVEFLNFRIARKPRTQPPPELFLKCSSDFGDYPSGIELIIKELPQISGPCECRVELYFNEESRPLKFDPIKSDESIAPFKVESQVLKLSRPDGWTAEAKAISAGWIVEVKKTIPLTLDPNCFQTVCALVREELIPLRKSYEPQSGEPA
jgi:hypothetical protein